MSVRQLPRMRVIRNTGHARTETGDTIASVTRDLPGMVLSVQVWEFMFESENQILSNLLNCSAVCIHLQ